MANSQEEQPSGNPPENQPTKRTLSDVDLASERPKRPRPNWPVASPKDYPEPDFATKKRLVGKQWVAVTKKYQEVVYKYATITADHVRILYLEKGEMSEEIYATIKTVTFKDLENSQFHYEALSYHWGEGDADSPINIREDENSILPKPKRIDSVVELVTAADIFRWKRVLVKPNLYLALQHFRDKSVRVALWVDALCINQENLDEKKAQVAKMPIIYHNASNVLIWLGPATKRTKAAMKFIPDIIQLKNLQSLVEDPKRTSDWGDLIHLMKSSWFSRRWVIQELALAKDASVYCGEDSVHWSDFRDAIGLFVQNFDTIKKLFKNSEPHQSDFYALGDLDVLGAKVLIDIVGHIFLKDGRGSQFVPIQGLEILVSTLSTFETSDPRDTVHAFRNICKEVPWLSSLRSTSAIAQPPESDYRKDLLDVYIDFVRWVVEVSGSIDIICRHWAVPERCSKDAPPHYPEPVKLPSWIQEITDAPFGRQKDKLQGRKNGDSFVGLPGHHSYNAAYGKRAEVWFNDERNEFSALHSANLPNHIEPTQTEGAATQRHLPIDQLEGDSAEPVRPKSPPNSTSTPKPDSLQLSTYFQSKLGSVDGDSSPSSMVSNDVFFHFRDGSLNARGLKIGTLKWVTDAIPDGVIPRECLQKAGWNSQGNAGNEVPDKIWRTLVAERGPDGRVPPALYQRACHHCLVHDTPNGHINTGILLQQDQPDIVRDFLKRVQAVTWNRRFMEADPETPWAAAKKLFGLVPAKAHRGDLVCILYGCTVPVILRPRREGKVITSYRFIGESYVYGYMDGEAITCVTESQLQDKTEAFRLL